MKTVDIIKEYYKTDKLEVLDDGKVYGEHETNHYGAVSLDYIHKYVLKETVTKRFVAKVLFKLCIDKRLRPIPCNHARDLVFINYNYFRKGFYVYEIENNKITNPNTYWKQSDTWMNNFNKHLK